MKPLSIPIQILLVVVGCISLILGILLKEAALSLCYAPVFVDGIYGSQAMTERLLPEDVSLCDLELICRCFLSGNSGNAARIAFSRNLRLYADKNNFYVLPLEDGNTSYAAQRYGVRIDRKTGQVFNKYLNQWETYGYTSKTVNEIESQLKVDMVIEEVFLVMGRPFIVTFSTDDCLLLEYNTKNGVICISLKHGCFNRVSFYDHNAAIRL